MRGDRASVNESLRLYRAPDFRETAARQWREVRMRCLGLVTVVVMGLAAPVAAEEVRAATRAYGQIATFPLADGFVAVHEQEQRGRYLLEFVPEGEAAEDWTQMITLSAAEGLARQVKDPLDMASMIGAGFRDACPDTFWGSDEGVQEVAGADAAHLVAFSCGDYGGRAETALILVAVAGADVLTLQWAERGPAAGGPVLPDPALWGPRGEALLALRLCPAVEGKEAPYPSCLD